MSTIKVNQLTTLDEAVTVDVADIVTNTSGLLSSAVSYMGEATGTVNRTLSSKLQDLYSVKDFGVVGDGVTDDTAALQLALDSEEALFFPAGTYLVSAALTVSNYTTLIGVGRKTLIRQSHTGSLFTASAAVSYINAKSLSFQSVSATTGYIFDFSSGNYYSTFDDIYAGYGGGTIYGFYTSGTGSSQMDTITFDNIFLNGVTGDGYNFAGGSSVWITGGRVIGPFSPTAGTATGYGVFLNGGLGGLWVTRCDIIQMGRGMSITDSNGTSNREIFITDGCFDSCGTLGLTMSDNSFVVCTDLWAASCEEACLHTATTFTGILEVNGGTLFNAGGYSTSVVTYPSGAVFNGGSRINIDGVLVRSNGVAIGSGRGIWCPSSTAVSRLSLSNVEVHDNATTSIIGASTNLRVNGCLFDTVPSYISLAASPAIHDVRGNTGAWGAVAAPTIPTSGGTVTYNTSPLPATVYIASGSVSAVTLNGSQIMAQSNFSFQVNPGDVIGLTYSSAPTWSFVALK